MAGDWIKMRTCLLTSPKVNGIARIIEDDAKVARSLSTGYSGVMSEIVTRNVMRHVTVSCLLIIWGAANEHTSDGVFKNADLADIDDMVGVPGFAEAMRCVGWLEFDEEENTVSLPNFNEYNTSGGARSANAKSNADRQREYRERKKSQKSNENSVTTSDVTSYVTSNRREEKRREEVNTPHTPRKRGGESPEGFDEFWSAYPRKVSKPQAEKAWRKLNPDTQVLQAILDGLVRDGRSDQWLRDGGAFIPYPATWLNGRRWEDDHGTAAHIASQPAARNSIFEGVL